MADEHGAEVEAESFLQSSAEETEAIEVRGHVRTRSQQVGKTAAVNAEARLRASLSIVTRCSMMLDEARKLEVSANDLGDRALQKRTREHVLSCEDLLSFAMKRVQATADL